ncbi:hypothetical protein V6Z12_A10G156500 [Gossypium hirsutum]
MQINKRLNDNPALILKWVHENSRKKSKNQKTLKFSKQKRNTWLFSQIPLLFIANKNLLSFSFKGWFVINSFFFFLVFEFCVGEKERETNSDRMKLEDFDI